MQWSPQQLQQLADAAHHHPKPGVRVKALAVLAVAHGHTRTTVAQLYDVSRVSVGHWVNAFAAGDVESLQIAPGRGRKRQIDDEELVAYARQRPELHGVDRSRWTIQDLTRTVPSARGMSTEGVRKALRRAGLRYKRGQPWRESPDPDYDKKNQVVAAAIEQARKHPNSVVAVYEDEASFYRQPSQGCLFAPRGRNQPRMPWSQRSNTLVRVAGSLDAVTGALHHLRATKITVPRLIAFYKQLLDAYPDALMLYVIEDNWPVHFHARVLTFLAQNPRLQVLRLPTYAPWLNKIERTWRWVRQTLCHAHPFCDDFEAYKAHLDARLAEAAAAPEMLGRYCGLQL